MRILISVSAQIPPIYQLQLYITLLDYQNSIAYALNTPDGQRGFTRMGNVYVTIHVRGRPSCLD